MAIFKELVNILKEKNLTLACAESCTGGLFAAKMTDVGGASQVFYSGVVSYVNHVKMKMLGVKKSTISKFSEVSYKCAEEMALGARSRLNSNIGVSFTGVAGPTGGTKENPVGTIYVGFSFENRTYSIRLSFSPCLSRDEIRQRCSNLVAKMLVKKIMEKY